jgi:hypothetical protein
VLGQWLTGAEEGRMSPATAAAVQIHNQLAAVEDRETRRNIRLGQLKKELTANEALERKTGSGRQKGPVEATKTKLEFQIKRLTVDDVFPEEELERTQPGTAEQVLQHMVEGNISHQLVPGDSPQRVHSCVTISFWRVMNASTISVMSVP